MKWRRFLVLILIVFLPLNTWAQAENILKIQLKNLGTDRFAVGFEVYRIGDVINRVPVLEKDFGIEKFPEKASEMKTAIQKISSCLNKVPYRWGRTDMDGLLVFDGLEEGVYLVRQKEDAEYGKVSPFIAYFPFYENHNSVNMLEITPKASVSEEEHKEPIPESDTLKDETFETSEVKTGDFVNVSLYIYIGLAAVLTFLCALLILRKKSRGD